MPFLLGAVARASSASCPSLRALRRARPASSYTVAGLALVVVWLLPFRVVETLAARRLKMDFSMWIVGGLLIVVGAMWASCTTPTLLLGAVDARLRADPPPRAGAASISMAYPLRAGSAPA